MELNADKCHILHFGKRNPRYEYQINGCKVSIVNEQEDLGVIIDDNLNFTSHYVKARNKANKIVGFIKQSVTTRKPQTMVKLFSSLVRPILEYAAPFWSPHLCKDIDMLENVQRRFTRLISGFENIDYKNRLDRINLFSLEYRRHRGQLIETYKFFNNLPDTAAKLFSFPDSSRTRGHHNKIKKRRFRTRIGQHVFANAVVDDWNRLPRDLIDSKSVTTFKLGLDGFFHSNPPSLRY